MFTLSLILVAPLLVSVLTAALRSWPRAAAIFGACSVALLALFTSVITPGAGEAALEWDPLGRRLLLDTGTGRILVLLYLVTVLLLLMAALWPQGRDFAPAVVAALAPLALALMIRPFVYGAVALLGAATIKVAVIQAGRTGSTRAAMHFLTVMVLAVPFFLVSGWMLESEQLVFLRTLWRLLLAASILLLAGVPFHFWVRPLVEDAAPLAVVFVLGLGQLVAVTFTATILREYPVLAQTGLAGWLRVAGVLTMGLAGLLAYVAGDPRRAIAYAALLDMGAVVGSLGAGSAGWPVVLLLVLVRTVGLALAMVGMSHLGSIPNAAGTTAAPATSGWWPALLTWYGALSLVGLPLTPGFAGRWAAVALLAGQSPWFAAVAIVAVGASTAGLWRTLPRASLPGGATVLNRQQPALPQLVGLFLLLVAVLFALFPAWPRAASASLAALFV